MRINSWQHMRRQILLAFLVALPLSATSWADRPEGTPGVEPNGTFVVPSKGNPPSWAGKAFTQGVVSTNHPLATEAGARVLERGGNAIDAAAAVQFVLNVVEPMFSGIGGGGFMMVHLAKTKQTFVIDSREKAPAAATPTMFQGWPFATASLSGFSVGVPGTLKGVTTALAQYGSGRFTLAETMAPAIELAENGFPVNGFFAGWTSDARSLSQPETIAQFHRPGGAPMVEGDILVQKDLAKTFRLIAAQGPSAFYSGPIAEAIVAAQRRTLAPGGEGRMELSDLAGYDVEIREPIFANYRGYKIVSSPPPSSGGPTMLLMLKMLERFPLGDESQGFGFAAPRTLNLVYEAIRLGFADRSKWMGDPDFVYNPINGLLSPDYVASRSALLNPDSRMASAVPGNPLPFDTAAPSATYTQEEGIHTTHFSIVDKWGNMVTYTTTIESQWGSGILVPGYGFLLNNELTDFNFVPQLDAASGNPGANDLAPGKRPRTSMGPSIIFKNGKPFAAFGSPGGAHIINAITQVAMNLIDHHMSIQDAIDAPRISGGGGAIFWEPGLPTASLDYLRALGHTLNPTAFTAGAGAVQAVVVDLQTGKQYGGADPRRGATTIGLPRAGH